VDQLIHLGAEHCHPSTAHSQDGDKQEDAHIKDLAGRKKIGQEERLENAGLLLKPAHVGDDLVDIIRRNAVDFRHVAEFPMVGFDTIGGG